jgi:hypothetical protein
MIINMTTKTTDVKFSDVTYLAQIAYPEYAGRLAQVRISDTFHYDASDLTWDGGTRTEVVALWQVAGVWQRVELSVLSPTDGRVYTGKLTDDVMLVEHRHFCGRDHGLVFVVSPTSSFLPKGLIEAPAPALSEKELFVLGAVCTLTSAGRKDEYQRRGIAAEVPSILSDLAAKGMVKVNRVGAASATIEGCNVHRSLRGW